jgi:FkbM family methyltransferase
LISGDSRQGNRCCSSVSVSGKISAVEPSRAARGYINARLFGSEVELDLADWIQRSVYLGTYEPIETRLVAQFLTPGMTVVDVGANIGYYTALAASKVGPHGRIFAIEPDARAFARLEKLIAENHLPACAFNFGLGDKTGEEHLYQSPDSRNNTPTMVAHGAFAPKATVPMKTLDDCLDEWKVVRVDLLKIDVEGWEPRVCDGASRALTSGRISAILCEFNGYWLRATGSSAHRLWNTLVECGYHPAHEVNLSELSGDSVVNCLLVR